MTPTTGPEADHNKEAIVIDQDTLVALDLDRTLMDSGRLVDLTLLCIEDGLDPEHDRATIEAIEIVRAAEKENIGNSFSYLEALQAEIGNQDSGWVDGLATRIVNDSRDDDGKIKTSFINQIMLPGAVELVQHISSLNADWIIMTAGQNITQRYKIFILSQILAEVEPKTRPVSYLITDPASLNSKADMIVKSFAETVERDQFDPVILTRYSTAANLRSEVANRLYGQVVLVDDKSTNLEHADTNQVRLSTILVRADNNPANPGCTLDDLQHIIIGR